MPVAASTIPPNPNIDATIARMRKSSIRPVKACSFITGPAIAPVLSGFLCDCPLSLPWIQKSGSMLYAATLFRSFRSVLLKFTELVFGFIDSDIVLFREPVEHFPAIVGLEGHSDSLFTVRNIDAFEIPGQPGAPLTSGSSPGEVSSRSRGTGAVISSYRIPARRPSGSHTAAREAC